LHAWLLQRLTAVFLAIYLPGMGLVLALQGGSGYPDWRGLFGQPWAGVLTAMFAMAVVLHVWVGMRDVLIDYIHAVWLRLLLLSAFGLVLIGSLLWVVRALALAALQGAT
jgi:succinate dehydrogenase / fumarate reductase membrane anchor subunit